MVVYDRLRSSNQMHFPIIILLSSISLVNSCSRASGTVPLDQDAPPTPHILFVLADDLGFHDVGYHGSEISTPVIDKLARNGVILENYYVQPLCTPSRSQLMTGKYQIHTGLQHSIFSNSQPTALPLEHETLAEKLRDAGYATHIVGKWHLGFFKNEYLPTSRGFDTFYGSLGGGCDHYDHVRCTDDTQFCGYDFHDDKGDNLTVAWEAEGRYSTNLITKRALNLIYAHDPKQPLFLFLSYRAVHTPLQVPFKYEQQYSHILDWKRRTYAGMTSAMDEGIGRVVSAFRNSGFWQNTVMIFSTDNGGSEGIGSNLPLTGYKGSLWEGGIRGVGFVSGQMINNSGTIYRGLLHISDWFPTLVNLANGTLNTTMPIDGLDVWEAISTGSDSPRTEILHNINPLSHPKGRPVWRDEFDSRIKASLRMGPWKIITGNPGKLPSLRTVQYPHDQNIWLFNIHRDPMERRDLSRIYPGKVHQMLQRLAEYQATAVPAKFPDPDPESNPYLYDGAWGPWM